MAAMLLYPPEALAVRGYDRIRPPIDEHATRLIIHQLQNPHVHLGWTKAQAFTASLSH